MLHFSERNTLPLTTPKRNLLLPFGFLAGTPVTQWLSPRCVAFTSRPRFLPLLSPLFFSPSLFRLVSPFFPLVPLPLSTPPFSLKGTVVFR